MEKNELKELIREVVKEEIRIAFGRMIITDKSSTKRKLPAKVKANESRRNVKKPIRKTVNKPKQNYTNNSVLNDVLNETAQTEDWKQMGGTKYTSERMSEVMQSSYGDMMNDSSQPNKNLAASMGVNPDTAPSFLTKDYSKVMKAIDKKKGK